MTRQKFHKDYQFFRTTDKDVAEIHAAYVNENAKNFRVRVTEAGGTHRLSLDDDAQNVEAI